jgi:hypothetical protein
MWSVVDTCAAENLAFANWIGGLCPFRDIGFVRASRLIRCREIALVKDANLIISKCTNDAMQ